MPVQPCTENGKPGRRWGKSGRCYPCDGDDCSKAHRQAEAQGKAIEAAAKTIEEYASPGRAFARQARMETIIVTLMGRSMKRFLATVTSLAAKWGASLSPVAVEDAWRDEVNRALESPLLSAEATVYVHDVMIESAIPTDAYATVVTVYRAAAEQHWSDAETRNIVRFSLSPDTPTATAVAVTASADDDSLTAAARRRKGKGLLANVIKAADEAVMLLDAIDTAKTVSSHVAAADSLAAQAAIAGITYLGQSWWDTMRAEAHSAVTGLEGHLTQSVLASFVETYEKDDPQTKKRWVTRKDGRVRHTHKGANGQTVPVGEPFVVGGAFMMYPGDRSAPVEETANCRCVMVAVGPRLRDPKTGRFKALPRPELPRAARGS